MILALGAKAQEASFVEKQYPGNETADRVVKTAIAKQQNAKTTATRTSWIANRVKDNWFISIEGGLNHLMSEGYKDYPFKDDLFPTGGLVIGKWFSPVWGLRLSTSGGKLKGYQPNVAAVWYIGYQHNQPNNPTTNSNYIANEPNLIRERYLDSEGNNPISYLNLTADVMVNLKHLFLPYNSKGFFNPVIYGGVGYVSTLGSRFDPFKTAKTSQTPAVGNVGLKAGLQLNFRLCDPWQLYLAAEGLMVPENFDRYVWGKRTHEGVASVKLGLTYLFNFRHFIKPEFADPLAIANLNKEINDLRNRPQPKCPPCPEPKVIEKQVVIEKPVAAIELKPVFFAIGSHEVRDNQLIGVALAAEYLISHPKAKLELVSYADKKTGTPAHNLRLSKKRTDAVAKILINKFGIDKKRLTLKHEGDTKQPFAENDQNRVTLFIK
jgi:outer membrane protein OmpA-like peptidoglycan-associated protein